MTARGHLRIFLIATLVWTGFWVAGLPSYYQQYPDALMVWFVTLLLIPITIFIFLALRRLSPEKRLSAALWLSFYFTVPLAFYDWLFCGLYLGHGIQFISTYWYLSIYYVIPWILLPLMALLLNRTRPAQMA